LWGGVWVVVVGWGFCFCVGVCVFGWVVFVCWLWAYVSGGGFVCCLGVWVLFIFFFGFLWAEVFLEAISVLVVH